MAASRDNNSTETRLTQCATPTNAAISFGPGTNPEYSKGLWQPIAPSIFVVMTSTFNNASRSLFTKTGTPIAHCPTLDNAHEALQALAQRYSVAGVTKETHVDHSFSIVGADKTRAFWVVEVGHAHSLKMVAFDDKEGGLCCEVNEEDLHWM